MDASRVPATQLVEGMNELRQVIMNGGATELVGGNTGGMDELRQIITDGGVWGSCNRVGGGKYGRYG